jgi:replicative DNA helicase
MNTQNYNNGPAPREMPNNIEAEQALLGAALVNNRAFAAVTEFLIPDHFYEPLHQRIYRIMGDLISQNKRADPVTIRNFLSADDKIGDMTVAQYLAALASNAVSIINAKDYGQAIHDLYLRRQLIFIGEDMVNASYNAEADQTAKRQIDLISQELFKLSAVNDGSAKTSFSGSALSNAYIEALSKDPSKRSMRGVPIVLPELQTVLCEERFEPTNVYSLVSSSGEGKTSLTLQIIRHAASYGHPVAFFSFDQSADQCVMQMVAQQNALEVRRQKAGDLNDRQFESAMQEGLKIGEMPLEIFECNSNFDNMEKLAAKAIEFMKRMAPRCEGKTPLFVFDHMSAIPPKREFRSADEGSKALSIGNDAKALAKITRGACLLLQQRSGAGVKRVNPRPVPGDLYGGEAARQAFDAVAYLYRAEEYQRRQLDTADDEKQAARIRERFAKTFPDAYGLEDTAEVGTLKVRFGKVGQKRYLKFVSEFTKYQSIYTPMEEMESML